MIINDTNIGRIGNWNKCLELADSKYILFLFSNDEISETNNIAVIINEHFNKYPTVMFNTLYRGNSKEHVYYSYNEGEIRYDIFIKEYFIKRPTSFGILQSHLFDLETMKTFGIKFDQTIDRTTDRVFISDVISTKGIFYYSNNINTIWNLDEGRYHYNVHEKINANDLYLKLEKIWIQEMKADVIILSKTFGFEKSLEIFFLYINRLYYSLKNVNFLKFGINKNIEFLTLKIFIPYLDIYLYLSGFDYLKIIKLRMKVFIKLFFHMFKKIFKILKILK